MAKGQPCIFGQLRRIINQASAPAPNEGGSPWADHRPSPTWSTPVPIWPSRDEGNAIQIRAANDRWVETLAGRRGPELRACSQGPGGTAVTGRRCLLDRSADDDRGAGWQASGRYCCPRCPGVRATSNTCSARPASPSAETAIGGKSAADDALLSAQAPNPPVVPLEGLGRFRSGQLFLTRRRPSASDPGGTSSRRILVTPPALHRTACRNQRRRSSARLA